MKKFKVRKSRTTLWRDARKSAAFDEYGSGENVEYCHYCDQNAENGDLLSRKAARFDSPELFDIAVNDDGSNDDNSSCVSVEYSGGCRWLESDSDLDDTSDVEQEEDANVNEE